MIKKFYKTYRITAIYKFERLVEQRKGNAGENG
jgi:hypothetical protein